MRKTYLAFIFVFYIISIFAGNLQASDGQLIGARFPALSPDGTKIAFSYMGDIWVVSSTGGKAVRLTNHVAYDGEPVWSPDGEFLAFTSNRMGNNDIYIIPAQGGIPKQLTFHSGNDTATDFSPDGKWIYFTSSRSSSASVYKINITGGNALPVLDTYWSWTHDSKVSPDGESLIFALGMENNSKWRRGFRTSNSAKIWIKHFDRERAELIVSDESNSFWPCWSPDGDYIFFVSDRDFGACNIWSVKKNGLILKSVTKFTSHDVRWMSVARNVPRAVYERNFGIWITDLTTGESHAVSIESPSEMKENSKFFVENEDVSEFHISPDGKKIAAVVRGEVFILSSEGGYARNITNSPWRERDIDWDKESQAVVFVSDRDANTDLYIISALGNEKPRGLTNTSEDVLSPKFSPDGKWIAYYRGKRQLRLVQPDGRNDRLILEDDFGGRFADDFAWAPDSRYIAVVSNRSGNSDIIAVNIETQEKIKLTNTAYDESSPVWSPDGKALFFSSNRFGHSFPEFTGKWDIYRVFLEPQKPEFKEDEFEMLFIDKKDGEKESSKDKKDDKQQLQITFKIDNLDLQTEHIANTLGSERLPVVSDKDSKTVYFVSNMDGRNHLWKTTFKDGRWGMYESFMAQVTNPRSLQFDASGKSLYYISRGKIGKIDISGKKNTAVSFTTKIEIDKTADYEQMLAEVYYTLQHYFYDANLHNVNWKYIYEQFRPVLKQVREDRDFYDYANEMIGYLNSSHTGIRGPRTISTQKPSPHIGAQFDFSKEMITIAKIIENGPLYFHRDSVSTGDELMEINGEPVTPDQNIWKFLNGKMDQRITVTFRKPVTGKTMQISLKPVSNGVEKSLIRDEWVESRRQIVKKETNDQAAYIYMQAMGRGDLDKFLKELERDAVPRKGLILDLRNNFGGNVHDRVLQALTKPLYAKWRIRGMPETNQSTYGFSHKPVVLLVNEVTLSDGEMTANGFKALKRGTIIGNTTYGWLIFTTGTGLMNGGYFRLPFWGCYTLDGQDIETMGGIKPDILIVNDLNHDVIGEDPQLDKAIEEILKKIN